MFQKYSNVCCMGMSLRRDDGSSKKTIKENREGYHSNLREITAFCTQIMWMFLLPFMTIVCEIYNSLFYQVYHNLLIGFCYCHLLHSIAIIHFYASVLYQFIVILCSMHLNQCSKNVGQINELNELLSCLVNMACI